MFSRGDGPAINPRKFCNADGMPEEGDRLLFTGRLNSLCSKLVKT